MDASIRNRRENAGINLNAKQYSTPWHENSAQEIVLHNFDIHLAIHTTTDI